MKKVIVLLLCVIMTFPLAACVKQEDYDELQKKLNNAQEELASLSSENSIYKEAQAEVEELKNELSAAIAEKESIAAEYETYKETMKPYESLSVAEAEAKTAIAKKEKAEAEKALAEQKAAEEKERARLAKEQAEREAAEEAKGYETGITFDQLARTPNDYKDKKVKFKGTVIQVLESDNEINIRLAIDDDYDKIILGAYLPSIVSSRVLEEDTITIYGKSNGLYTYESTLGGKITIPLILIDRIDQN